MAGAEVFGSGFGILWKQEQEQTAKFVTFATSKRGRGHLWGHTLPGRSSRATTVSRQGAARAAGLWLRSLMSFGAGQ